MEELQLKRLEAYGFKSFADKIEIEFHPGITAIVGPNGSGKSNITDAIRWVLGEQNIRTLRGAKTEDIIFAGSSTRKQLGVAEASVEMESSFIDDLGADSLDIVELVMALEEEFDMEIPDTDAEKVVTVGDVVEYIKENV